jgi:hypothetical protein
MTLLPHWSGILMINPARPRIVIHNDASGVKGIGGWWDKHHAYSTRLPKRHRNKLIAWKEAYAVLFAFAEWGESWRGHTVVIMCDNTVVVNGINARSVRGEAIDPLQLLFLTAALYDIEISCQWLSSKDNWIADALSRFEIHKIADIFPQFQTGSSELHPHRMSGRPMLALREKLRTFFGMDSLPILAKSIKLANPTISNSLQTMGLRLLSLSTLKRSPSSLQQPPKKRRRKQRKHMSATYVATTLTKDTISKSSTMNVSNAFSGEPVVSMEKSQGEKGWRSRRKSLKRWLKTSIQPMTTSIYGQPSA